MDREPNEYSFPIMSRPGVSLAVVPLEPDQTFAVPQPDPVEPKPMRPKELRRWIEGLPVANVEALVLAVTERLNTLNRSAMPVTDRSELLEMLREPADLALQEQQSRHALLSSLNDRERRLVALAQRLRVVLVVAYKVLIKDLHASWLSRRLLWRGLRVQALHRQIHYLGRILLADSQLYLPPTPRVWLELHRAYHFAEKAGVQNRQVPNEDSQTRADSSVADQYKLWLLLSLAGPYRLQQGQVVALYGQLQRWAPQCNLYRASKRHPDTAAFAVDRTADRPPVSALQLEDRVFEGWYLDVTPLAQEVEAYLDRLPEFQRFGAARPSANVEAKVAELLPRLLWSWGVQPARTAPRETPGGTLSAICGLEAVHGAFVQDGLPERKRGPAAEERLHRVSPVVHADQEDVEVWLQDANVEKIRLLGPGRHGPVWTQHGRQRGGETSRYSCRIYDRSQGGYRLGVGSEAQNCLRVGELLALDESAEGASPVWHLASVRWIRRGRDGELEFGAQRFSGKVQAVILERRRSDGGMLDRWRALLVGDGSYEEETIITPAFYAEAESLFTLIEDALETPIELVHTVEITSCFAQFRFAPLY